MGGCGLARGTPGAGCCQAGVPGRTSGAGSGCGGAGGARTQSTTAGLARQLIGALMGWLIVHPAALMAGMWIAMWNVTMVKHGAPGGSKGWLVLLRCAQMGGGADGWRKTGGEQEGNNAGGAT